MAKDTVKKKAAFGPHSSFGRMVRWQRLIIQIVFLIFAPQTFSLAFAGVKQLFTALGARNLIETNSFLFLMLILVAFTIVFGRFFCGYLCAFGTIGDIVYKVVHFPFQKLKGKGPKLPAKVEGALRYVKYVVLAFFLIAAFAGFGSVVNVYSPWTAFGRLLALNFTDLNLIGLILLVLIVVGMAFKERFFCEFLCPMGAVFSLLPVLPFSAFRKQKPPCNDCGACKRACPAHIDPPATGGKMGECFSCGRCATVCHADCIGQCSAASLANRLSVAADGEAPKRSTAKRSQLVKAIVLAVVMFAIFWLFGAVDHIPTLNLL